MSDPVVGGVGVRWAVIGCGNPNRQDDGVGSYVIDLLKTYVQGESFGGEVRLFDAGTNGMEVMYQARGASSLIIVDAQIPGNFPGAIYEVPGEVLENASEFHYYSHSFRWDHALYMGRKIFKDNFPKCVKVFLIQAAELGYKIGLTDAVESSAHQVAKQILDLVSPQAKAQDEILLDSGKIYLSSEMVEKHFSQVRSVAIIVQEDYLQILPVHGGVGGYLLKIRNSIGDCVIAAHDVLFNYSLDVCHCRLLGS